MMGLNTTEVHPCQRQHLGVFKMYFNSYNGLKDVFVQLQAFQARRKNCQNTLANLISWKLFLAHFA